MNQSQQTDLKNLLLELLSDTRMVALLQYFRRLPSRRKRLLLRIAKGLH